MPTITIGRQSVEPKIGRIDDAIILRTMPTTITNLHHNEEARNRTAEKRGSKRCALWKKQGGFRFRTVDDADKQRPTVDDHKKNFLREGFICLVVLCSSHEISRVSCHHTAHLHSIAVRMCVGRRRLNYVSTFFSGRRNASHRILFSAGCNFVLPKAKNQKQRLHPAQKKTEQHTHGTCTSPSDFYRECFRVPHVVDWMHSRPTHPEHLKLEKLGCQCRQPSPNRSTVLEESDQVGVVRKKMLSMMLTAALLFPLLMYLTFSASGLDI